jgi:hypothetical protein
VNAQFTVTLSPAASKSVTVDYATADGTATSGTDYTSAMATLTFAPGETSKSIDVAVRGDTSPENNETFFITLKNAAGATLARTSAFAVIDDDDQSADVALSVTFSNMTATVKAANSGPRAATDLRFASTATPALAPPPRCAGCGANQLPSGTAISPLNTDWVSSPQQYFTTAVTARQRDPQLANNSLAWTARGYLAMDALYLTPGSQANVSFTLSLLAQYAVESSNPAVVSVSATTTTPGSTTTFVAHALSIGTATIRLLSATSVTDSLVVDVVPAGTTPRWPGAINVVVNRSEMAFDQQALFTIENKGTAPYSGITATGLVTLSVHGRELGRITLGAKSQRLTLAVSPVETGQQQIDVTYAGDANFLPSTTSFTMTVTRGAATMTASAQRSGTAVNVHVRLVGSQMVTPGGTITFSEQGARQTPATLTATAPGVSEADVTMTGIAAGPHTFTAVYSGDANYISTFLNIPLIEGRGHAVRH